MYKHWYSVTIVWRPSKRGYKHRLVLDEIKETDGARFRETFFSMSNYLDSIHADFMGKPGHLVLTVQDILSDDKLIYSLNTTN